MSYRYIVVDERQGRMSAAPHCGWREKTKTRHEGSNLETANRLTEEQSSSYGKSTVSARSAQKSLPTYCACLMRLRI